MKNFLIRSVLILSIFTLGFACDKGGEEIDRGTLTLSTKLIEKDAIGGTKTVTLDSPSDWYAVSSDESWITVRPTNGTKGETKVTVSIKSNTRTASRAGEVHFKAGKLTEKIRITQDYGKFFILPCDKYTIDYAGGKILIGGLPENGNYKITIPEDTGWLTVADNELRVAYNANTEPRSTVITIADNANSKSYKVTIIQESSTGKELFSLHSLTIDGIECLTDSRTVISDFYYSVDMDLKETSRKVKIEYTGTGVEWIQIGDSSTKIYSGDEVTIKNFTANNTLKVTGHNSNVPDITGNNELIITGLPLVNIITSGTIVDEPKVDCKITIFDPKGRTEDGDQKDIVFFESLAGIEYRGAGAQRYPKKPYNFKLRDVFGEKREAKILGIRNDNSWILDAMYLDMGRMRTRLNFDLWNTFNRPYYVDEKPKAMSGTRGHMTEAFINGEYFGIFMLTDRIDRKQYQIEQQGGYIYKSKGWTDAAYLSGYSKPSNDDHHWSSAQYEQEYPGPEDGAPNFNYMAEFIDFVAYSTPEEFSAQFAERIDEGCVIDTFIFLNLILGYDNAGRNTFWIFRDVNTSRKIMHGLWDLDGTLGRDWNRVKVPASNGWLYGSSNNPSSHFKLFKRIIDGEVEGLGEKINARWNELKANQLSAEKFNALVDFYAEQQIASGARDREVARWKDLETQDAITGTNGWIHYSGNYGNVESEAAYMKQWYSERLVKLDQLIKTLVK